MVEIKLSCQNADVLKRCLQACLEGSFFPDWEVEILTGFTYKELESIYKTWPVLVFSEADTIAAIRGTAANLFGYPHGMPEKVREYIPEDVDKIMQIIDALECDILR